MASKKEATPEQIQATAENFVYAMVNGQAPSNIDKDNTKLIIQKAFELSKAFHAHSHE